MGQNQTVVVHEYNKIRPPAVRVEFPIVQLPKDEEGFVQSFSIDEKEEIKRFLDEYGLVVVRDVLSPQQCSASIDEVWTEIEEQSCKPFEEPKQPRVKRDDPTTWQNDCWPRCWNIGVVGSKPASGRNAWLNRTNENIYELFRTLYNGEEKLWCSADRWGLMRPTRDIRIKKNVNSDQSESENAAVRGSEDANAETEIVDKPEWRSNDGWVHWDMNPWKWTASQRAWNESDESTRKQITDQFNAEYSAPISGGGLITENNNSTYIGFKKLQGLVALTDAREDDGGFLAAPGFNRYIEQWADANTVFERRYRDCDFVNVPEGDPVFSQMQRITMRAGSIVVWDSTLPHCNYPNNSSRFRINQYLKLFPAPEVSAETVTIRGTLVKIHLPSELLPELTDTQQRLLSLQPWTQLD